MVAVVTMVVMAVPVIMAMLMMMVMSVTVTTAMIVPLTGRPVIRLERRRQSIHDGHVLERGYDGRRSGTTEKLSAPATAFNHRVEKRAKRAPTREIAAVHFFCCA